MRAMPCGFPPETTKSDDSTSLSGARSYAHTMTKPAILEGSGLSEPLSNGTFLMSCRNFSDCTADSKSGAASASPAECQMTKGTVADDISRFDDPIRKPTRVERRSWWSLIPSARGISGSPGPANLLYEQVFSTTIHQLAMETKPASQGHCRLPHGPIPSPYEPCRAAQ